MDLMFTYMTAKEGIKRFGELVIAEMIKYFKHLDEVAVPVKPVGIPTFPDLLTKDKIKRWMP